MESKEIIYCKYCGKPVKYARDSRQYCNDTCKDLYHYKQRKDKLKKVRLLEKFKADPLTKRRLQEEVIDRLTQANDPILQHITIWEKNIVTYETLASKLKDQISKLSADITKLEKEQKANGKILQNNIDLKKWIEQEEEAIAGIKVFEIFDRWSELNRKKGEIDSPMHKLDLVMLERRQKEIDRELAQLQPKLDVKNKTLVEWDRIYAESKNSLSEHYYKLNVEWFEMQPIAPTKRPAKRSKTGKVQDTKISATLNNKNLSKTETFSSAKSVNQSATIASVAVNSTSMVRIFLGTGDKKQPIYWNPLLQSNPHALAVGKSGSGKTAFLGICCYEAFLNKVPVLSFDYDGGLLDHRMHNNKGIGLAELISAKVIDASIGIGINPLALPKPAATQTNSTLTKLTYQDIAQSLAQSLSAIFHLSSSVQKNELWEAIERTYEQKGFSPSLESEALSNLAAPTMKDVWLTLTQKSGNESYQNMLLRLKSFLDRNLFTSSDAMTIGNLFSHHTLVNLSGLTSEDNKAAICRLLLGKIFDHMIYLGTTDKLRLLIVLDEAHFLMQDESVTALIRNARKFGIGLLLASHSAKDFSETLFNIVGTKLALRLEGSEAKRMADNMGVTDKKARTALENRILNQDKLFGVMRNDEYSPYSYFKLVPLQERD